MTWNYNLIFFEKGCLLLVKNEKGLNKIKFLKNRDQADSVLNEYKRSNINISFKKQAFEHEESLFRDYFQGKTVDFSSLKLDFSAGTPFQKKIWRTAHKIPYGRTETYKSLAHKINHKGYRSVGGALGKNPFLIAVPCHRVISTDGTLGGFGAGLELKRYLLRLERNTSHI